MRLISQSRRRENSLMDITHDTAVWFSKSFGLFYLVTLSIGIVVYAYWPSNKKRFDQARR
jgi:cytochrome c oxidase cbb3-type subunit 4